MQPLYLSATEVWAVLALTFGLSLYTSSAEEMYIERNPALGVYQDESRQYPIQGTWYMLYRNYKTDPIFGGTAKCVRFSQTGVGPNGENLVLFEFDNGSVNLNSTLSSSPGYSTKNIVNVQPFGQTDSAEMITSFVDPLECDILRIPSISESACVLIVPESRVSNPPECCEFIFDLLCGTTPKYEIYDESCSG
ncbi:uncharacterized protein LOC120839508 [Ixodes scapularis]|uniref:uncharacterized protein LOC120839508 n=1 Tax=Ixodes scapularis TaxID=6945 RepID=UPI001A9FCB52|nr:uncharacterized protein LOC120839508 [Ixodes scapularis]